MRKKNPERRPNQGIRSHCFFNVAPSKAHTPSLETVFFQFLSLPFVFAAAAGDCQNKNQCPFYKLPFPKEHNQSPSLPCRINIPATISVLPKNEHRYTPLTWIPIRMPF